MSGEGNSGEASAYRDALELLARRPLTETEVRSRLLERGHRDPSLAAALDRLREHGYLDDQKLALHFITTRAARLRHGPRRLVEQLRARGLDEAQAERALRVAVEQGELDLTEMLRGEIRRRLRGRAGIADRRHRARVYNALLRAGYESDRIEAELGALAPAGEVEDEFA